MKSNKKLFASFLAGFLAFVMLLTLLVSVIPMPQVSAEKTESQIQQEIAELERQKAEIDREIDKLQAKVDANMSEIELIVAEKDVIDKEIALLHDKMTNVNDQIAVYSTMIADSQKQLDDALARLAQLKQDYKDRIRVIEKNGKLTYWNVIFQANSFSDLLDRLNMVEEIERSDRDRMNQISQLAEDVEKTKSELEVKKTALEQTRTELEDLRKELDVKRQESDAKLQELLNKGAEYEKYLEEQEAKADELNDKIDENEGLLDEIEREKYEQWLESQKPANGNGSQTGSNTVGGKTWIVPISYSYFSSPYGYRVHPIGGDWRFHNGVDLSAPMGTPIYAARSGKVYYRGWWGTGGNTIMINHQDGYISRYLHMDSFAVSDGAWVAQGQVIGYCGTTGGSTGPHLHFEMQYNGSYVNPADYIYLR